jgi:hypothetical protein
MTANDQRSISEARQAVFALLLERSGGEELEAWVRHVGARISWATCSQLFDPHAIRPNSRTARRSSFPTA